VDTPVTAAESTEDGGIAGVRLDDGQFVARRVLAVATTMQARTEGLGGLELALQDLPGGMGRHFVTGMAGTTEVPGAYECRSGHRRHRCGPRCRAARHC
jgi:hypothetical protein